MMGASSGSDVSLAKLVLRNPSEAMERTSKLQRRTECREPLGASLGCGSVAMKSICPPGTSKLKIRCVGALLVQNCQLDSLDCGGIGGRLVTHLPMQATGTTRTCMGMPSWLLRRTVRMPSNSLMFLHCSLMVERSDTNMSSSCLLMISSCCPTRKSH